jgi:hypothetical protein
VLWPVVYSYFEWRREKEEAPSSTRPSAP